METFCCEGKTKMVKIPRKAYTLEFKQEAVRLVESGQRISEAARSLGVVEQTLSNWVRAHRAGKLSGSARGAELTAELSRLRKFGQRDEWKGCSLTAIKMAEKRSNDVTTPTPDPHSSL